MQTTVNNLIYGSRIDIIEGYGLTETFSGIGMSL